MGIASVRATGGGGSVDSSRAEFRPAPTMIHLMSRRVGVRLARLTE
jgi:hypothetical protein